jgi:hypothetical protein
MTGHITKKEKPEEFVICIMCLRLIHDQRIYNTETVMQEVLFVE